MSSLRYEYSPRKSDTELRHLSSSTGPHSPDSFHKEFEPFSPPFSPHSSKHASATLPMLNSDVRRKSNAFTSTYRSLSWIFGFKEKYTLLWALVFGGALLGYCLARAMMFSPKLIRKETTAGEFFWFDRPFYKVNYMIHIYLTLIGGIMVGIQFFPAIRRRAVILHRINGYFCLICLVPGNICGSLIAIKSWGGEINVQMNFYLLGIMITFAGLMGWYNVKRETKSHRKWMLRMVSYFAVIITARVISSISKEIITALGTYYSVWRCDQILYTLGGENQPLAQTRYPECFTGPNDLAHTFTAVLGNMKGDKLTRASATRVVQGMALWTATVIHVIGVEIYIMATEAANHRRYGYALEPVDYNGEEAPWEYRK